MPAAEPPNPTARLLLRLGRFGPAVLLMAAIWVTSGRPVPAFFNNGGPASPGAAIDLCDMLHIGVYALLGLSLAWALRPSFRGTAPCLALGWALACLYGAADELHQAFAPDRTAAAPDLMMDAAGALCGVALYVGVAALLGRLRRTADTRSGSDTPGVEPRRS